MNQDINTYRDMIISNNESMKHMQKDIDEIKIELKEFIKAANNKFAEKKEFLYWRNIIITSLVGLIFSVISLIILESISIFYK